MLQYQKIDKPVMGFQVETIYKLSLCKLPPTGSTNNLYKQNPLNDVTSFFSIFNRNTKMLSNGSAARCYKFRMAAASMHCGTDDTRRTIQIIMRN